MILRRGTVTLEFFPHPDLEPKSSWFSCCLRLDDLDAFYAVCKSAGIPEKNAGYPRLHPPKLEDWGGRVGALIDIDSTLVRLIQNCASHFRPPPLRSAGLHIQGHFHG